MFKLAEHPYRLCFLIVAITLIIVSATQSRTRAMNTFMSETDKFYTCPDSFTFESRHQAARCIRYPQESFVAPEPCNAPFSSYRVDYQHHQDSCLSAASQSTELTCPDGADIYVQPGNDLCVKRLEGAVSAPMVLTKR